MKRRAIGVALTGAVLFGCGRGENASTSSAPLLNGNVLTPQQAAAESAVSVMSDGNQPFGAATIIGPKTILSAAHVFTTPGFPIDKRLTIGWGNASPRPTTGMTGFINYPSYKRAGKIANKTIPVDIGVAFLSNPIPGAPIAPLDCDPTPVPQLHCVSGEEHVLIPGPPLINGQSPPTIQVTPLINDAVFGVLIQDPFIALFRPNGAKPVQEGEVGDSGMGCYRAGAKNVTFVERSVGDDSISPGKRISVGTLVPPFCGWINKLLRDGPPSLDSLGVFLATEQQIDKDHEPDSIELATVAGDDLLLTIGQTGSGEQSFPVTVPGVSQSKVLAAAIGNFNGAGQTLAVLSGDTAGGTIQTASFNGVPQPSVSGATGNDYLMLSKADLNGDKIDDLVAQHADGGIEAFVGGASGLNLSSTIKPIAIRADRDSLSDFVWFTPGTGQISLSSSINGVHANTLTNQLKISDLQAGRFRRGSGASAGIEDVVTLDTDTAGGGVVVWCDSTEASVECHSAIDARFINQTRNPIAIDVFDTNEDGLDDVTVTYAGTTQPPRIFLATPDGLPSAPASAPAKSFVNVTTVTEGGNIATIGFDNSGQNNTIQANSIDSDGNISSPINTGIAFVNPLTVVTGNFNDDGTAAALTGGASALGAGQAPFEDVAILSGGHLFALISNQDGTFSLNTLSAPPDIVSIASGDVTADGIDDLQATRNDGSVIVFAGIPGTGHGLSSTGENFTGLPTPDGSDGKLLLLSGLGVDTVGATEARIKIQATADDPASLDHLTVQIFDGDNGGLNQFDKDTNLLKTCYRLTPDPCGDGNVGNCNGGQPAPAPIATVTSATLHDNAWDTIFSGPHSAAASLTGNGQAPFTYELRVYLAADCSQLPGAGAQIHVATADGFKVRATGMVSQPAGEFSLVGADSNGPFGIPNLPYMSDTSYDGSFSLPIAVGSSATEIQLKESDADSLNDTTRGVSVGANDTIQYQLLRPNGTQAPLVGAENTSPTLVVTNPSGNNDGVSAFDVETRISTITSPTPGTWVWKWNNVGAGNAIHVFAPFGSPTTHEVLGARRVRPMSTTAQEPAYFQTTPPSMAVVLGHESATRELEGSSVYLADQSAIQTMLQNPSATLEGELQRQLLTAKLNAARSLALGEDVSGALVYGRTLSARTVMNGADDVVAGVDPFADGARVSQLIGLLSSINLGELNYQLPGVPFSDQPMADDDNDGIVNMKDNCPALANPLQEDADGDRIGDACHVRPIASCVLQRSEGQYDAFFGYENPLSFRAFAVGSRNLFTSSTRAIDPPQPSEFTAGSRSKAFHQSLSATEIAAWTLDGETVFANADMAHTAPCSGRELTLVDFAPQTAIFGTDSVTIGHHSRVTADSGLPSVASNGDIVVGSSSVVGNVLAGARVSVADYGSVLGLAATSGGLDKRATAAVNSTRSFTWRPHSLAWVDDFAAGAVTDIVVGERQQQTLESGEYGDVTVEPQAQLLLGAGLYRFRSLTVREQGSLRVTAGDAVVHVANALQHAGDTRLLGDASLVIGYFGSQPAAIVGSLQAAVIAPNASLTLGTAGHAVYTGSFFAKQVVVGPGTQVKYFDAKQ